jgi:hypothetical protein
MALEQQDQNDRPREPIAAAAPYDAIPDNSARVNGSANRDEPGAAVASRLG